MKLVDNLPELIQFIESQNLSPKQLMDKDFLTQLVCEFEKMKIYDELEQKRLERDDLNT